jgi:hypothetical protein
MKRFVIAGKESTYTYLIEGVEEQQVVVSLYLNNDKPTIKEFLNKSTALAWISYEVNQLDGARDYGR